MLEVNNIVKTFKIPEGQRKKQSLNIKEKIAVNGVSFKVNDGEIFGLLGPNGAGKTTIMRILSTLIKPNSGDVYFNDASILKSPEQVRSQLAFLTTDLKLDNKSTANEMYEFFSDLYHVPKAERSQRKEELFNKFGVSSFSDVKIGKLSQGMKQRLSLSISILHDPQFIIFDEPTNGLDIIAEREVRNFILDMKKQNKCIIVSTHIFGLVEKTCDKVAIIIDGDLVYNSSLDKILETESLEDFFFSVYSKYKNDNLDGLKIISRKDLYYES